MVQMDEIRQLLIAKPFQPFSVLFPEGRRFRVLDAEYARVWPGDQLVGFDQNDNLHFLSLQEATGIELEAPKGKRG